MNERGFPALTLLAGLLSLAAFTAFALLHFDVNKTYRLVELEGWGGVQFLILGVVGWFAALVATLPLVKKGQSSGLVFAFLILALMIFFVHETYQYKGAVRLFPLLIGYSGMFLSVLDILTTTDTALGRTVTRATGSALVDDDIVARKATREFIACAAICVGVASIYYFGFLLGGSVFVGAWMLIGGRKSFLHSIYGGVATFAFVFLMFEVIMKYTLHRGVLTEWFWETYIG